MEINNGELDSLYAKFESLKGLVVDGDINLSAIKMKRQIALRLSEVTEAKKNVAESLCTKNKDGSPKTFFDEASRQEAYDFSIPENGKKCVLEINKINKDKCVLENSKVIEEARVVEIRCTQEQMEALLILTEK